MGNNRRSFLKRTFLVEKAYQIKFILKIVAFVVLATILTGVIAYFLTDEALEHNFYSIHSKISNVRELLLPSVIAIMFVVTAIVAFFTTIISLIESHKVGGPIYRFKMNLDKIGNGDLNTVSKLREGDELQDFTATINQMTKGIKTRVIAIDDKFSTVKKQIGELGAVLSRDDISNPDKEKVQALNNYINDLENVINDFKFKE